MIEPRTTRLKSGRVGRSVLRVVLVVVAALTVMVVGTLAFRWKELKRAGAPTTKSNVLMLQAAVLQLWADGFTDCPTLQQVLELNLEPLESELRKETTGIDPWGTPYLIQCDQDQARERNTLSDDNWRTGSRRWMHASSRAGAVTAPAVLGSVSPPPTEPELF